MKIMHLAITATIILGLFAVSHFALAEGAASFAESFDIVNSMRLPVLVICITGVF